MKFHTRIFAATHNWQLPYQGCTLISEPFLQDSYFQRSVVLLVEHSRKESVGIILNKKTNLFLNTFVPELKEAIPIPLYLGGPVSKNHLFFIHTLGDLIVPNSYKINEHLYFGGQFEAIKRYIQKGYSIEGKVKFFLGYSGWSEGQLEQEIAQDSWMVCSQTDPNLMVAEGDGFWKESVNLLGNDYEQWTLYPKDPALN